MAYSAHLNALDPVAYLYDIIEDIHYQRRPLSELTPIAYAMLCYAMLCYAMLKKKLVEKPS